METDRIDLRFAPAREQVPGTTLLLRLAAYEPGVAFERNWLVVQIKVAATATEATALQSSSALLSSTGLRSGGACVYTPPH